MCGPLPYQRCGSARLPESNIWGGVNARARMDQKQALLQFLLYSFGCYTQGLCECWPRFPETQHWHRTPLDVNGFIWLQCFSSSLISSRLTTNASGICSAFLPCSVRTRWAHAATSPSSLILLDAPFTIIWPFHTEHGGGSAHDGANAAQRDGAFGCLELVEGTGRVSAWEPPRAQPC